MENIIKPKQKIKQKGYADVVFLIDSSGSMTPVFDGLKNHIGDFIEGMNSANSISLSWRIALIGADMSQIQVKDFTDSTAELQLALNHINISKYDEASYQALDYAISMDWRDNCKKIIVFFTDEPLSDGQYYEESKAKTKELAKQINESNIKLFNYSPDCPDYQELCSLTNGSYFIEFKEIEKTPFSQILNSMGKTISNWNYQGGGTKKHPLLFEDLIQAIGVKKV